VHLSTFKFFYNKTAAEDSKNTNTKGENSEEIVTFQYRVIYHSQKSTQFIPCNVNLKKSFPHALIINLHLFFFSVLITVNNI